MGIDRARDATADKEKKDLINSLLAKKRGKSSAIHCLQSIQSLASIRTEAQTPTSMGALVEIERLFSLVCIHYPVNLN